jgi:hypothetical protein
MSRIRELQTEVSPVRLFEAATKDADIVLSRSSWEATQHELEALTPDCRRLANWYRVELTYTDGAKYPFPARKLTGRRGGRRATLRLGVHPEGGLGVPSLDDPTLRYSLSVYRERLLAWLRFAPPFGHFELSETYNRGDVRDAVPQLRQALYSAAYSAFGGEVCPIPPAV